MPAPYSAANPPPLPITWHTGDPSFDFFKTKLWITVLSEDGTRYTDRAFWMGHWEDMAGANVIAWAEMITPKPYDPAKAAEMLKAEGADHEFPLS